METVSKKNVKETGEMNECEKKHEKALIRLYKTGEKAEKYKTLPLGENTRAAIYVRAKVSEVLECLFDLNDLLYTITNDETGQRFADAASELEKIANEYIIASIDDSLTFRDADEI